MSVPGTGAGQGCQSSRTDGMFPLSVARIYEEGLPQEVEILGFWDFLVPIVSRTCIGAVCSSLP